MRRYRVSCRGFMKVSLRRYTGSTGVYGVFEESGGCKSPELSITKATIVI